MRLLVALVACLVCATGAAAATADTPRYEIATVGTLEGPVSVMRDTTTGVVTFLPDDPAREWRVLDGETLATYANGQPATVFVFHPPFDAWTWLEYWYGFVRADVESALASAGAASAEPLPSPPLDSTLQIPEPYDFFGANVDNAAAVEPFRFAYAGTAIAGLPLWNIYISRLADPASASVVAEYTLRSNGPELAVETLPRAVWSVRAWGAARPLTRAHGIAFRFGDGQIYGRTPVDWIVVHGAQRLSRRECVRLARAIRFR